MKYNKIWSFDVHTAPLILDYSSSKVHLRHLKRTTRTSSLTEMHEGPNVVQENWTRHNA